ncbi:hypothetical protein AVEN_248956-1 [Araneus ventricosus]|uniref:Uncharacterized protein n=1 Tax=Araneus ventricosus TaxID=182803 RepID=A0A4Y2WNY1_ARAVE|nr:hypothetical protein AVEN_248956-1 [Araneus ventricosus]
MRRSQLITVEFRNSNGIIVTGLQNTTWCSIIRVPQFPQKERISLKLSSVQSSRDDFPFEEIMFGKISKHSSHPNDMEVSIFAFDPNDMEVSMFAFDPNDMKVFMFAFDPNDMEVSMFVSDPNDMEVFMFTFDPNNQETSTFLEVF